MVVKRMALSHISSHFKSDLPWAGFEPTQTLSSGFIEWSCPAVKSYFFKKYICCCYWYHSYFRCIIYMHIWAYNAFMYIYILHVFIYLQVYIHTKSRFMLNFCCNNLSKVAPLGNYWILHYYLQVLCWVVLNKFRIFLSSDFPTCCIRSGTTIIYSAINCLFEVNNGVAKARCEVCSGSVVKTPEQCY